MAKGGDFQSAILENLKLEKVPLAKKFSLPCRVPKGKVILIGGPTACGKTTLSLMIARHLGGEIVSADSMQVYRGMDIGTAKVAEEERARIPHHLIDIRHVQEPFNVVDFYYEARKAIDSILARGKVPLIVGGSGFYFHTLLYGPPIGPPPDPELRARLSEEINQCGVDLLFNRLKEFDPEYAATITANDRQKVIRALEIITLTGSKVSSLNKSRENINPDYRFLAWFLHRPRDILYRLIEKRCEAMVESGLVEEVESLLKQGLLSNPSASHAIGYVETITYLKSQRNTGDFAHYLSTFKQASRHYAKKQFTWFRKEKLFRWLDVELHDFEIAADMIMQDYSR